MIATAVCAISNVTRNGHGSLFKDGRIKDDGQVMEISDEWRNPQKATLRLSQAFSGFNARQAKRGFHTWKPANGYVLKRRRRNPC
jgi:hypothetical protein